MSKQELQRFLEDVAAQPRLRQSFDDNPNAAIAGYEIAPEEMGALKSRDPASWIAQASSWEESCSTTAANIATSIGCGMASGMARSMPRAAS